MSGLIDFLVFDLLMGDEAQEYPSAKRRSAIFDFPLEKPKKKAPIRKASSSPKTKKSVQKTKRKEK